MKSVLVTGAAGHLGRNLVEHALDAGLEVTAVVRHRGAPGLDELERRGAILVEADLTRAGALDPVMAGQDAVLQCAARFRHWSRHADRDIVGANAAITEGVLRSAHAARVPRLVYVSSVGVLPRDLGRAVGPLEWATDTRGNPYFGSKLDAERTAWRLAGELGLDMVSVLPGAMLGGRHDQETPTTRFIRAIHRGEAPFDLRLELSIVDVDDVCRAMLRAVDDGRRGERYILANPQGISMAAIHEICRRYNPRLRRLMKIGRPALMALAGVLELLATVTGVEPQMVRSQVRLYYGSRETFDIESAQRELGFSPRPAAEVVAAYVCRLSRKERAGNNHAHEADGDAGRLAGGGAGPGR